MDLIGLLYQVEIHFVAAKFANERENEAMCVYHLGVIHGLLVDFFVQKSNVPVGLPEPKEPD